PDGVKVILPDLNAGCSMADMADLESVEEAWESLAEVTDVERIVPITYMNSSAALKAFVGRNGGAVCTSSNARAVLTWALDGGDRTARGGAGAPALAEGAGWVGVPAGTSGSGGVMRPRQVFDKVLFFPDQHLGRNTGYQLGYTAADMHVWNPRLERGGLDEPAVKG